MADALWTSRDIAAVTGGRQVGPAFEATGVSIDSREVVSGDLFVALTGERDGHLFTPGALSAGASGVLASKPVNGPHVLVPDTLKALEALGAAARDRSLALRAAVTGSVGKTSVTQAIAAGTCRRRPLAFLGQVLQQPHRCPADPGADALGHRDGRCSRSA
jgi:UDP-N-acetylmuramoyl-tripeptide--D-alanyl-D-alanine ligase